ncbi:MAG: exodeoxyribonuclease VII large subunit [Phycisphaeraceae bacterium]|nr:exodeoxyribonuclease VII large subunit [Phycisphaeraceae bacterium]
MDRLPFDPTKMQAARTARAQSGDLISVSTLATRIEGALRSGLESPLSVVGQVSGFRERTHWYFDLKDERAVVNCVVFASNARRAGFVPRDGMEVVLRGRVELYAPSGKLSLIADRARPVGEGALEIAYRRLCEEIRQLGWFDEVRKRAIPTFPQRVAIITSESGAALHDVLETARQRCPAVGFLIADVRVQGEGAAGEIATMIQRVGANAKRLGLDAVLVTRGGGSREDLWAFNERLVAEAIVRCPVPVVAAIGHETDTTIAELVADRRAATPTQAAMLLVPDGLALARQVESQWRRLGGIVDRGVSRAAIAVGKAARSRVLSHPGSLTRDARQRLREQVRRLALAGRVAVVRSAARIDRVQRRLERHRPTAVRARLLERVAAAEWRMRHAIGRRLEVDIERISMDLRRVTARVVIDGLRRLESAERELEAVGPRSVLRRGYSYTTLEGGTLVRSAAQVSGGEVLLTIVRDGEIRSRVEGTLSARPSASAGAEPAPAKRPRRTGRGDAGQMDLFSR